MWCLLLNGLIGILLLVASLVATYWILHLVGSLAEKFHLSAFGQGPYSLSPVRTYGTGKELLGPCSSLLVLWMELSNGSVLLASFLFATSLDLVAQLE